MLRQSSESAMSATAQTLPARSVNMEARLPVPQLASLREVEGRVRLNNGHVALARERLKMAAQLAGREPHERVRVGTRRPRLIRRPALPRLYRECRRGFAELASQCLQGLRVPWLVTQYAMVNNEDGKCSSYEAHSDPIERPEGWTVYSPHYAVPYH